MLRSLARTHALVIALLLTQLALPAHTAFELTVWPAGRPTPALDLSDLEGQVWNRQRLLGRVVVLNFWATWCEPCRAEMPSLAQLAQQHPPERLVVLAANYQESESKVRRYLDSLPLSLPVLLDRDGLAARSWTRRIFPTTVIIGPDGRARYTLTGEFDWASPDAAKLLEPLLRTASTPRRY